MSWRSSKADRRTGLPQSVLVARIRRPHGVRGELLVDVLSDVPGRLAPGSRLNLVTAGGQCRPVEIVASRQQRSEALVRIAGLDTREEAATLRGAVLEVERHRIPPAPRGSYYYFELVGCLCRDREAGDLGAVIDVKEDGGGLLLEVSDGRRRLLVPFVKAYLDEVDVERGRILLDLPEGLIETCASMS